MCFLRGGGVHVCMCFFNKGGLCTGKSDSLKASSKACVPKDPWAMERQMTRATSHWQSLSHWQTISHRTGLLVKVYVGVCVSQSLTHWQTQAWEEITLPCGWVDGWVSEKLAMNASIFSDLLISLWPQIPCTLQLGDQKNRKTCRQQFFRFFFVSFAMGYYKRSAYRNCRNQLPFFDSTLEGQVFPDRNGLCVAGATHCTKMQENYCYSINTRFCAFHRVPANFSKDFWTPTGLFRFKRLAVTTRKKRKICYKPFDFFLSRFES